MRQSYGMAVAALLLLVINDARAELVYAAQNGFHLQISREVNTPPRSTYAQFLRVGEWWNGDHTWFGDARGLSIEPKAGGCFCERDGDRSALHMLVSHVNPGKAVHMVGGLGPLQGLGLHGAMVWNFEALEDGGTRIVHGYGITGYHPDGLQALAAVVDKVQTDQVERLKARLDASDSPRP